MPLSLSITHYTGSPELSRAPAKDVCAPLTLVDEDSSVFMQDIQALLCWMWL